VCLGLLHVALLAPAPVGAEPYFAVREGLKCSFCHVNQTGGGKRTDAFAATADHFLRTHTPAAASRPAEFLDGRISIGSNVRVVNRTLFRDDPDAQGRVANDISEMKHAEKLIERILFLEGQPIVSKLDRISIGKTVEQIHQNDWQAEESAIKGYNESIRLAAEVGDNGTKTILEAILKDEEEHIDWLEAQKDQIEQMGLALYLAEQIG
jgi:bacterioferritin